MTLTGALYLFEWVVRLGALVVVPRHRPPSSTTAWLLLILFLPLPGLVLFLLIGRASFPRWRRTRFAGLRPFFEETSRLLSASRPDLLEAAPIGELAEKLGGMPATAGNTLELIDDYDQVIAALVSDIDAASHTVELLVYIYADDEVGRRVAEALHRAVERGVRCRVMLDPVGSGKWRAGTLRLLRNAGVEVLQAMPFRLVRNRTRRDMRNHRKLFVIDGAIGYAGSQNIVAKDFRKGVTNRELVARVTGPIVASMDAIVQGDWSLESGASPKLAQRKLAPTGSAIAQLLPSGADYPSQGFETLLVWQLHQARSRVIIVTPYFIPDEALVGALRTAVARGVVVHLIVSAVVDQRLVNMAQSSYYEGLLAAGVKLHLFRDYLLHAKNISIDGQLGILGSSNVDLRSFQLNEEASLLLYDQRSVAALEAVQLSYLEGSSDLTLDMLSKRSKIRVVVENVARLVSPLL